MADKKLDRFYTVDGTEATFRVDSTVAYLSDVARINNPAALFVIGDDGSTILLINEEREEGPLQMFPYCDSESDNCPPGFKCKCVGDGDGGEFCWCDPKLK